MQYGAYNDPGRQDIVWFRTERSIKPDFYHRHERRQGPPDVCIAKSVPELIMKVYPWIHEQESALQQEVDSAGLKDKDKNRISDQLTDRFAQRLDPDDDAVWGDEPHWLRHLHSN